MILLHHIISDGWSKNVLVRELAVLFQASPRQTVSARPNRRSQYGDFAIWEHDWIEQRRSEISTR